MAAVIPRTGAETTPEWMARAACAGMDPELFHPDRGESSDEAKAVCAGCPVQLRCRWFALSHLEKFGVWGGLSERQRRQVRRSPSRMDTVRILAGLEEARERGAVG